MCGSKRFIFLVLVSLPILWSCAETRSLVFKKVLKETPPPAVKDDSTPSIEISAQAAHMAKTQMEETPTPAVKDDSTPSIEISAQAARMAKTQMDAGEYQKAIDIYSDAHRNHPHDQALLMEYVESLEKIKTIADQAYDWEDFVSAGRHYAVLIKSDPYLVGSKIQLAFNTAHLDEKFSISKKMISRKGFEEYRKGNLDQAIALWQAYVELSPNDQDIMRALNTAKLQQKNLPQ